MKTICIFLILIGLNNSVFSQKTTEEKISEIRIWYAEINSGIEKLSKTIFDYPDESTEGGEIILYKNENKPVLLKVVYYGETGNMKYSFYFRNEELFFVFQEIEKYSVPIYVETNERDIVKEENRYYFYCNKMIKWIDSKKQTRTTDHPEFIQTETELLNDVKKLLKKTQE
jgi:hypothetical protein